MDIIINILLGIGLYLLGCFGAFLLIVIEMLWDRFVEHLEFEMDFKKCFVFVSFSWISVLGFGFIFLFYDFCYLSYRFCLKYVFGWFKHFSKWFKDLDIWDKKVVWDKYGLRITYYYNKNG